MSSGGNPLSAGSLSALMASSLPKSAGSRVGTPFEAVAIFCHACMLSVGFRLVGLGEDDKIEADSDAHDARPLPSEWNASSSYAFRYTHPQSSMEHLVKVSRLGSKAMIFGIGMGADRTTSFDINVKDYVSDASLPFERSIEDQSLEEIQQKLQAIFITPARIMDLSTLFKLKVLQKLMPSLQKEGYEESPEPTQSSSEPSRQRQQPESRRDPLRDDPTPQPARPHPLADPLAMPPRRPVPDFEPPGFEDEHQMNQPGRGYLPGYGGRNPLNIGDNDLYPPGLGPHDPLRGTFGPGGGGGLPRPGGGGGMHPSFDDPLFGGRGGGQGGFNPRVPPGARYDPVHGDEEPFGSAGPRFPGGPGGRGGGGRQGGGPPNPFGGFGSNDFI
ncbi:MAG: hypothetical protein M4579_004684 [Chaenotheca gracillima]|nr:MAG: hypothetical protein M4579_004684 [Chaenotheca gracillima]